MEGKKDRIKIGLGAVVLIVCICGIGMWIYHTYTSKVNYDKIQMGNRDELRQEYINMLYKDKELTRSAVSNAIIEKDLKQNEGTFTESRPEQFIYGLITAYEVNDNKLNLQVNYDFEKIYNVNDLLVVDIPNQKTIKLKAANGEVKTEDNDSINLEKKKIYIIVNDLNADSDDQDNTNRDDVFILSE